VRHGSTADALVRADDGTEVVIRAELLGHAHNGDRVAAAIIDYRRGRFFGVVMGIISRGRSVYAARLSRTTKKHLYFALLDHQGREVCAEKVEPEPGPDDLVFVSLDGGVSNNLPRCVIVDFFPFQDESRDLDRIVQRHNLPGPHGDYAELQGLSPAAAPVDSERRDFRGLVTFTIDGADAKDFDDAISLVRSDRGWMLYVHIADVSAYVATDTPLDREARDRGTSFYLGNDVIPMLPELLSNDLCSLRAGMERLTLTAEILLDYSARTLSASFHQGRIVVDRRLTYDQADAILDAGGTDDPDSLLREMYHVAMLMKNRRMKQGRLDLDIPEEKLIFEEGRVRVIEFARRLKSHTLIEEFMLTANECASRLLTEKGVPCLHRVHEAISDESMASLKKFLRQMGVAFSGDGDAGKEIQKVIESVQGKEYGQVVNFIVLKSLMQAYYGVEPLGHFGLAFKHYTHFTSPIRRYPDLVVHRCLKALLAGRDAPYSPEELDHLGILTSERERLAQKAERDMVKLKSCRLLHHRIGEVFPAIISSVVSFGFFVTLRDMPIEGLVPLRNLTDDYYLVKEDEFTVVGRRLGRRFRLGDALDVRLEKVEIDLMRIDFDLA
jgi:ribonuclease R